MNTKVYLIEVLYNTKQFTEIIFKIPIFCRERSFISFALDPVAVTNTSLNFSAKKMFTKISQ